MPIYWIPIIVFALIVIISLVTAYIFANIVMYSRRQPIVRNPAEYGLDYEDVEFASSDGLKLKGWLVPAKLNTNQVVILTHPMPFNRHGFLAKNQGFPPMFKTDVDLLKMVSALHQAGYAVLTFDFRNHGESDPGLTGVGLIEYQDVLGAIRYVNQRFDSPQIGFTSFCMGANATIVALSKGVNRIKNVKFLVAIQPVSASVFFRCYLKNVYTPLSLYLLPIVDKLVQWRGGYALQEMSPLAYAKNLTVPTLYVQAEADPWTKLSDLKSFYEATAGKKELWLIQGVKRRFEAYNYVGEHPQKILAFAKKHFST